MKRDSKKKLVLDRNVVRILEAGALRRARGGDGASVIIATGDGDGGSLYPACPTTHSQVPGDC